MSTIPNLTLIDFRRVTLALPNYTGSLGYGEAAIHELVTGRCGRRDVDDCIASLDYLVEKDLAEEGPGRVFVMGGSHGGFLAAHRTWSLYLPVVFLSLNLGGQS